MEKMDRKVDQNREMKEWISEEYVREADAIIREVMEKEDGLPDDAIDVQGSYEKLIAEMKTRGIYREDSGKAEETVPEEPRKDKKQGGRKAARYLARAAAIVLVVGVSVFAGSMTSEANRNYLLDSINMMVGNDVQVNVSNNNTQSLVDTAENDAILTIEEELNVGVPTFMYRPADFRYDSYYVDSLGLNANLNYLYEEWVINLRIQLSTDEVAANVSVHGKADEIIHVRDENNLNVNLYQIQEKGEQTPSYLAQWKIDNAYYQLSGKIDYNELRKIIEHMVMIY